LPMTSARFMVLPRLRMNHRDATAEGPLPHAPV